MFKIDRHKGVLTLIELMPGVSLEEVKAKTEAEFEVSPDLKEVSV